MNIDDETLDFLQLHWEMLQKIADEHPNEKWCRVAADNAYQKLINRKKQDYGIEYGINENDM